MENERQNAREAQHKIRTMREITELAENGEVEQVRGVFDMVRKQGTPLWELATIFGSRWDELDKPGQLYCFATHYMEPRVNSARAVDTYVGAITLPSGRFAIYSRDDNWSAWNEEKQVQEYDRDFDPEKPDYSYFYFHGVLEDRTVNPRVTDYYDYGRFAPLTLDELEYIGQIHEQVKAGSMGDSFDEAGQRDLEEAFGSYVAFDNIDLLPEEVLTDDFLEMHNQRLREIFDSE